MEIILSSNIKSLSGSLGRGFGYFIVQRQNADKKPCFFSQRSRHSVPKDGHLKFIFACAVLAYFGSHVDDIRVSVRELDEAIMEATDNKMRSPYCDECQMLNAVQVLTLKKMLRL